MPRLWKKRSERYERNRGGGPRSYCLGGSEPKSGSGPGDLAGQPGLAYADRSGQHEGNRLAPLQLGDDPAHLGLAARERDLARQYRSHRPKLRIREEQPPVPATRPSACAQPHPAGRHDHLQARRLRSDPPHRAVHGLVLVRDDYTRAKPDTQPYLTALNRFGAAKEEALVVEDSSRGRRSAVAAGLDCASWAGPRPVQGRARHSLPRLPGGCAWRAKACSRSPTFRSPTTCAATATTRTTRGPSCSNSLPSAGRRSTPSTPPSTKGVTRSQPLSANPRWG